MNTNEIWTNKDVRHVTRDGLTMSSGGGWCECELCYLMDEFEQLPVTPPGSTNRRLNRELKRRRRKQIRHIYSRYMAASREADDDLGGRA